MDVVAGAKEAEAKGFPTFQPSKKEDSPPSTRDRSRRRSRQAQELAKDEGEKSEAKLREAIKILEGATFTTASSWRDFWKAIF